MSVRPSPTQIAWCVALCFVLPGCDDGDADGLVVDGVTVDGAAVDARAGDEPADGGAPADGEPGDAGDPGADQGLGDGGGDAGRVADDAGADAQVIDDAALGDQGPPDRCGDSFLDDEEGCDDGNRVNGDGCDERCEVEPRPGCGDGVLDPDEACDDGNLERGDGCDAGCNIEGGIIEPGVCGNGVVEGHEECDDGARAPDDGCDQNCLLEPACGDGALDDGEACDDGNTDNGDGCDRGCGVELPGVVCGDRNLGEGETCEDGNFEPDDGCDARCRLEADDPLAIAAPNGHVRVAGVIADEGFGWLRPSANCREFGNVRYYLERFRIVNHTGVEQRVSITAAWGGDGYLHVFRDPFNQAQIRDCVVGNDDFGGTEASRVTDVVMAPDQVLVVIASTFRPGVALGPFTLEIFTQGACGDAIQDPAEACDDGNVDVGDGCDAQCDIEPRCGDGAVDPGEDCDPREDDPDDFCDAACQFIVVCGNDRVDVGEQCDDGNVLDGDGCDADCVFESECGNGVREGLEVCDDGNLDAGDGCDGGCLLEPGCGNGQLDPGEGCDDGNLNDGDTCDAGCALEAATPIPPQDERLRLLGALTDGDSLWDRPSEQCAPAGPPDHFYDAYRLVNDSGADQVIAITAGWSAGDGFLHVFHEPFNPADLATCIRGNDDFNGDFDSGLLDIPIAAGEVLVVVASTFGRQLALGDYSISVYTLSPPAVCGDGVVERPETCDDGNVVDDDGCDSSCRLEPLPPVCGDGVVERPETCDDGNADANDGCDAACQIEPPMCGNGRVEINETCDDGNRVDGDGCDRFCAREPRCGDGILDPGEQCDDGNLAADDGCDVQCRFEQTCGDGIVEGNEACDDGNLADGDGCDAACTFEVVAIAKGARRFEAAAVGADMHDDYLFTVDHGGSQLLVEGRDCADDVTLEVFAADEAGAPQGDRLGFGDAEPGPGLCGRLAQALPRGRYLLRVQGVGAAVAHYDLDFRLTVDIEAGGEFVGGLAEGQASDLYVIGSDVAAFANFVTSDGAGGCPAGLAGDTRITFFSVEADGARRPIASDEGAGQPGNCASLRSQIVFQGQYEVVVDNPRGGAVPGYVLSVTYLR